MVDLSIRPFYVTRVRENVFSIVAVSWMDVNPFRICVENASD